MNSETLLIDYVESWLMTDQKYHVKQATFDRNLTSFNKLKEYDIANMPIGEITRSDIQQYVNRLTEDGYALTTIKKQMGIVAAPLKMAAAEHLIQNDPVYQIRLPHEDNVGKAKKEIVAYSAQEQDALWRVLNTRSRRGYAAIGLMLETGLRIGEALALTWDDVRIFEKKLHVHRTVIRLSNKKESKVQDSPKSYASNRIIPLSLRARVILQSLYEERKNEWVFIDDKYHERLSYEAMRYQTQCACQDANINYYGMHVFRHTFATNCYYKGMDVKILSKILGHNDVETTYNTYIHLYGDGFEDMYAALCGNDKKSATRYGGLH